MNRIGDLLDGLEDPWPLRRRQAELSDALLRGRKAARMKEGVRALARSRGEEPAAAPRAVSPDPATVAALREASTACAALEARWSALESAVVEAEEARGWGPAAPPAAVLAELDRIREEGAVIGDGFAPKAPRKKPGSPQAIAAAVGVGVLTVALGGGHFAVHAAMAAKEAVDKGKKPVPVDPASAPSAAIQRILAVLPGAEPSACALRDALGDLRRHPGDRAAWTAFLDAARERVEVLRRSHLRDRAVALLAQENP